MDQLSRGNITTEKTVWCSTCNRWDAASEFEWKSAGGMVKYARNAGWRKRKGFWVCPPCVKNIPRLAGVN